MDEEVFDFFGEALRLEALRLAVECFKVEGHTSVLNYAEQFYAFLTADKEAKVPAMNWFAGFGSRL